MKVKRYWADCLLLFSMVWSLSATAADMGKRLYDKIPQKMEIMQNPFLRYLPEAVQNGKKIYKDNCAICHGMKGNARGPMSRTQKPKPTNFMKVEYMALHIDSHLYYAISEGSQGTSMPAFKDSLDANEIWALISYIRKFHHPESFE